MTTNLATLSNNKKLAGYYQTIANYVNRAERTTNKKQKKLLERRIEFYEDMIKEQQNAANRVMRIITTTTSIKEIQTAVEQYKDVSLENSVKLVSFVSLSLGTGALMVKKSMVKFLNTVLKQISYNKYNPNACAEYYPNKKKWFGVVPGNCKVYFRNKAWYNQWYKQGANAIFSGLNGVLKRISEAGEAGIDVAYSCLIAGIMLMGMLTVFWLILNRHGAEMSFGYGAFRLGRSNRGSALPQPKKLARELIAKLNNSPNRAGPSRRPALTAPPRRKKPSPRAGPSRRNSPSSNNSGSSSNNNTPPRRNSPSSNNSGSSSNNNTPPRRPALPAPPRRKTPSPRRKTPSPRAGPSRRKTPSPPRKSPSPRRKTPSPRRKSPSPNNSGSSPNK